jgi:beta-glucosidase-like glycosyl hydrolase
MVPKFYNEFIDELTMLVKNEFIPMSRIDDAVRRILRVKFMMGIFENPFADYSLVKYLGIKVSYFPLISRSSQLDVNYKDHPINISSMIIEILHRSIEN